MDPKGNTKVTEDKEIPTGETPNGGETIDSRFGKKKEGKRRKHIKKIVYYDNDSSSQKDNNDSSSIKNTVKQNYSETSFNYSRITYNANAHLLFIPLGKPPHFDEEDNSCWRHKMCNHLFSLHPSIWDIVENGMQCVDSDDEITMVFMCKK
jgi:hypothetical protein